MPQFKYTIDAVSGIVRLTQSVVREASGGIAIQELIPGAAVLSSWVRVGDEDATATLPDGHGYASGLFDVFWAGGQRLDVEGEISGNALTLSGGAGNLFPASGTTVKAGAHIRGSLFIDGNHASIIAIIAESSDPLSQARLHLTFRDWQLSVVAEVPIVANSSRITDIDGGMENIFSGNPIYYVDISSEEDATVSVFGVQTVTDVALQPTAEFTADETSIEEGDTVQFTNTSLGSSGDSFEWQVNGVVFSTQEHPQYVFSTEGAYTISLTVTNAGGTDTETKADFIVVEPSSDIMAPTNLLAIADEDSITITWDDNADNETGYEIWRSEIGGDNPSLDEDLWGDTPYDTTGAGVVSYDDVSATPGVTYFYIVRAVNTSDGSAWSNTDSAEVAV